MDGGTADFVARNGAVVLVLRQLSCVDKVA